MKKEIIEREIEHDFSGWKYSIEISELKRDIEKLEKSGATHVNITSEGGYEGCHSVEICAIREDLETDDEFDRRNRFVAEEENQRKVRELNQLEYLTKKYRP